jgi:hypothetical protein
LGQQHLTEGQQLSVVTLAGEGITQHPIALLQLLKGGGGLNRGQAGGIGVIALTEGAKSLAKLLVGGLRPHLQQGVVAGGHRWPFGWR